MSGRPALEFLTRRDCDLCEEALPQVRRWAGLLGFRLQPVDVDRHPDLSTRYGTRVPVIRAGDGRVVAEGRIETAGLVWGLLRARLR